MCSYELFLMLVSILEYSVLYSYVAYIFLTGGGGGGDGGGGKHGRSSVIMSLFLSLLLFFMFEVLSSLLSVAIVGAVFFIFLLVG